jgi:hypothetical protein
VFHIAPWLGIPDEIIPWHLSWLLLAFIDRLLFSRVPLRLRLLGAPTAGANPIVVLGLDLLKVGQVCGIHAPFLIDRLALIVQTGAAALPQTVLRSMAMDQKGK